ncbi:MAG: helix-turn-helix transcriptional regulator [Chloroflexi bacterium]|nr:helix-turn-helix transcriptional regulator [Chloroflexota bacterium]
MENELQIPENLTIHSLEAGKVLSDPTRLEVMKYICIENKRGRLCTVKQAAKLMNVSPTKLYYHFKLLEEQNLLIVGDTRIVSGIREKQYKVAALNISLNQNVLSNQDRPIDQALQEILNSFEQIVGNSVSNIRASLTKIYEEKQGEKEGGVPDRKHMPINVSSSDLLLTSEQAVALETHFSELIKEFEGFSDQNLQAVNEEMLYFEVTQIFVPQYQRKSNT